jgi:hypothetical protein
MVPTGRAGVSAAERKRREGKGEVGRCGDLGRKKKWASGEEREKLGWWVKQRGERLRAFLF